MTHRIFACALLCLVALAPVRTVQAQTTDVWDQISGDAAICIVIPKVSDLNQKLAAWNQAMGMQAMAPQLNDMAGFMAGMLGMQQGLNLDGPMAVVFPQVDPNQGGPAQIIVVLPVSDYDAFIGNYPHAEDVEGFEGIKYYQVSGSDFYARQSGNHVLLAPKAEFIANYTPGGGEALLEQSGQRGRAAANKSDAMVVFNMSKVGPALQPVVQMAAEQMKQQQAMAAQQMGGDPAMIQMAQANMQLYFDFLDAVLRDGQSIVIGAQVSGEGLGFTKAVQLKPDSSMAQYFKAYEGTTKLDRLPDGPFLMAFSADMTAVPMGDITKALMDSLMQAFPAAGEGQASAMIDSYKQAFDAAELIKEAQFAWYGGELTSLAQLLNFAYVYVSDEPQQLQQLNKQYIEQLSSAMDQMQGDSQMAMPMQFEYAENVAQVEGQNVDQMTMKWEIPPQQAMMMGPVGMIFSEGLKFYLASTDEAMVMTQGGDMTMLNEVLAASGGSGEMQSRAAIENLRGKLESQRFVEGYVDLAEATRTVMGLMNTMMPGMVPPIQVPEDVPPMGFSVSLGDNALGGQAYLPVKTTMAIKDVSMQMAMMAAGPRGGGPGMGGPGQMDIEMDEPAEQDMSESTDTESDGKVTALTSSDFNEAVNDGVVLVDFWATWCAPCRRQGPIVESLAGAYGEQAGFAKVDIDANGQLAARFQIRAIPTLILFRDGEEVERFVGLTSRNDLATAINKALGN